MKKEKNLKSWQAWFREAARDVIALGSVPFFIIVLVRVNMLNNQAYFLQFFIAGILFLVLAFLLKANIYSGLGLIVVFFTSAYYHDLQFTIFAAILYVISIIGLLYLKYGNAKVIKGILSGVLATGISWFAVEKLFG